MGGGGGGGEGGGQGARSWGEVLAEGVKVRLALPPVPLPDRVTVGLGVMEVETEGEGAGLVDAHTVGDCVSLLVGERLGVKEEDGHMEGVTRWDRDVRFVADRV